MKKNRYRNHSTEIFWQKYFSILLAAVLFALGMLGGGTADAAKVTAEEVSRTVTIQPRAKKGEEKPSKTAQIKMHVMLENLDLKAYEKYTAELRKTGKYGHVVFAKAAPGSQISISAEAGVIPGILSKPSRGNNYSETINYYNHKKVDSAKDLMPVGKVNGFENKYTIPKDVEEVTAYVSIIYHVGMEVGKDMKSSTGSYRKEPALARHYYIFTSDAACKKAYDLMTGNSAAGAISSVLGGDKKSNAKSEGKQTGKASDGKDSGGLGTAAKIAIGVAAVGAIGFGAFKFLGKGRGGKENGAGKNVNAESVPQNPERFARTNPAGGEKQPGRSSASMNRAAGAQQTGRTGAAMNNVAGAQQTRRNSAAANNAAGAKQTERGHAAMSSAAPLSEVGGGQQTAAGTAKLFCKKCGAPLDHDSRFCENCGARNTPEFCTNCGAKLEPGGVFCGNCGAKV